MSGEPRPHEFPTSAIFSHSEDFGMLLCTLWCAPPLKNLDNQALVHSPTCIRCMHQFFPTKHYSCVVLCSKILLIWLEEFIWLLGNS